MNYEYVKTFERADKIALSLLGQPYFAIDTETTGLDHVTDKVTLVSITDSHRNTYVIDTRDPSIFETFQVPLEDEAIVKVGFNLNFDYRLCKGTFGFGIENVLDLLLGELCLTQGSQFGDRGLDDVTMKYLKVERDKTLQKSFIGHTGDFSEAQLQYAADDTIYLLDLAKEMTKAIRAKGNLHQVWTLVNRAMPAWADITYYGQKIDVDAWKKIMADNVIGLKRAKKDLDVLFEPVIDKNIFFGIDEENGGLDINYGSPDQVVSALQKLGIKVDGAYIADTNKKTQKKLAEIPVIKALNVYRGYETLLKNFGQTWLDKIHPVTGMIHPKLNQYGTESGRPSCNKPNVLNVPREKRYREAFIAGLRRLISTVDYSAAELRILADLSGDRLMIDGFNSGIDFHCFVATMLFAREVTKKNENKELRQPTKAINFGIAYGMAPYSLYERINGEGYKITLEDTELLFHKYCDTFHVAIGWLREQGAAAVKNDKFWQQTRTGRLRYWHKPEWPKIYAACEAEYGKNFDRRLANYKFKGQMAAIEREAGNNPIQSMNADMTNLAMYRLRKEIKARKLDAFICGSVYDEIVVNTAESCGEEVHELQKKIMVESANGYLTHVKMEVEGHLAKCWTK